MPCFYFDIDDGTTLTTDHEGTDLADREAARREAVAVLGPLADDVLPDEDTRVLSVTVRDDSGAAIYHATFTLVGKWLV